MPNLFTLRRHFRMIKNLNKMDLEDIEEAKTGS